MCSRRNPRTDSVGAAADILRQYACDEMITEDGRNRFYGGGWFAELAGPRNAPCGGGVSRSDYNKHVHALRQEKYADQLNLWQVSTILGIRIVVIPYTPNSADRTGACQDMNPKRVPAERTIYLGNNDSHYVWLNIIG